MRDATINGGAVADQTTRQQYFDAKMGDEKTWFCFRFQGNRLMPPAASTLIARSDMSVRNAAEP